MRHGKRIIGLRTQVNRTQELAIDDAIGKVKTFATAKFDETVEVYCNLGVDPRHADQMIRSTVSLPHGIGKVVRVLVLAKDEKAREALAAGAEFAGLDEYIEKIQGGWFDVDAIVATPDVMPQVGKIGKILGPRGLMPNPKTGTVTMNVAETVNEIKAGRLSFRTDKYGIIAMPVGKASFEPVKLRENLMTILHTLNRLKPSTAKGIYFKKITLSSTMGPGVRIARSSVLEALKA